MKIITRGEAMRIHQQHPASRLFPFCTGKYRWHGSTEAYTGREVQDIPGVLAVFAERRKDSFGFIFCLQRYHTMKIITRGEAMRIHQQHPASRLFPFCTGKYRWHGSTEAYTGREVQDIPGVLAVFAERRKDSFGPYVRLMSVTLN